MWMEYESRYNSETFLKRNILFFIDTTEQYRSSDGESQNCTHKLKEMKLSLFDLAWKQTIAADGPRFLSRWLLRLRISRLMGLKWDPTRTEHGFSQGTETTIMMRLKAKYRHCHSAPLIGKGHELPYLLLCMVSSPVNMGQLTRYWEEGYGGTSDGLAFIIVITAGNQFFSYFTN